MSALPPGPPGGRPRHTAAWIFRPGPFLWNARRRFGDTFTVTLGNDPPWVVLSDPDDVRAVFTGDPEVLHAGKGNAILQPILGRKSVLLLDAPHHLPERKLLLPPFHGDRMEGYAATMREIAEREIAGWDGDLAVLRRMQALTLSVITRTVFGAEEKGALHVALRRALDLLGGSRAVATVVALSGERGEPFFRRALKPVHDLIDAEIAGRRAEPGEDVLSMLVQTDMGDDAIRDELMTLLIAGHETTASGLAWAVERLARHPDAWARLRADGEPYADAVVKETLRLRPVIPIVIRNLQEDYEVGNHSIPAGNNVVPCIWLIHRREDLYPDPHAFRPERWDGVKPGTYTWIPFGGGVRRCIGAAFAELEMRIVLQALAKRHERLAPDRPEFEPVLRRAITLTPARRGRVRLGTSAGRRT